MAMDNQRLLKIVSTDDNSEVTILLPSDFHEQSLALQSQRQDRTQFLGHTTISDAASQLPSVSQPIASVYPPDQQSLVQYQANKLQPGPFQNSQLQIRSSQYESGENQTGLFHQGPNRSQGQTSQYQSTSDVPLSTTATRLVQSETAWSEKDLTTWTPKLSSGKWLQQDGAALQKFYKAATQNEIVTSIQQPLTTCTASKIKNSVPSIFPVKLSHTLSTQNVTSEEASIITPSHENQKLDISMSTPNPATSMLRGTPLHIPINLSSDVQFNTTGTNPNPYSGGKSVPVSSFGFTVNTQTMNTAASPVYKSKLEKAVEQNQSGNLTGNSGFDAKQGSGTLKKLLSAGISDIGPYQMYSSFDVKPHDDSLLEYKNQSLPRVHEQFLLQSELSTNKTNCNSTKQLLSKKDKLLEKTQANRFKEPYKAALTSASSDIPQQSNSSPDLPPGSNMGFTFSQLEQHLQDELKGTSNQASENYPKADPGPFKYSVKESDRVTSVQPPVPSSGPSTSTTSSYTTPFLSEFLSEVITEKEYISSNWGHKLLQEQWKLREEGYFCDAVFHCKERTYKFHRIVMSAVNPEFVNRDHVGLNETQLILPADILYENVHLFMEYIYLGKILLTVDNVQQIYRLSSLFGICDLNKYCYDFCKLAKMGHLIISSPYLETVKQVSKMENKESADKPDNENSKSETSFEISDVRTMDQIAEILTEKSNDQKLDPQSSHLDFDWLTFDPGQSNIPIRKRGRTRHKLLGSSDKSDTSKTSDVESNMKKSKVETYDFKRDSQNKTQPQSGDFSNIHVKNDLDTICFQTEGKSVSEHQSQNMEIQSQTENEQENTAAISMQLSNLPDPLATGKFDETQLIKQDQKFMKAKKWSAMVDKPTRKAMITRYRGKPKTMTVLEAASHKKAKYDNPIGMSGSRRVLKDRLSGRKNFKAVKSKLKNAGITNENRSPIEVATNEISDTQSELGKTPQNVKPVLDSEPIQYVATPATGQKSSKLVPAKKRQNMAPESNNKGKKYVDEVAEKIDGSVITSQTVNSLIDSSLPKKPRLRKSTLDQQLDIPTKDPVYMRPPKKRTKEIREMMKNETDGTEAVKSEMDLEEKRTGTDLKQKNSTGQCKAAMKTHLLNLVELKQKKPKKSKMLKDAAILKIVYEVEQYGRGIDGEKQYRCCLCNSVFVFSKRAITHIVNTHDIALNETIQYIDVEHKKPQSKKCDICGYVTKEINIYYIHFHKYFKHGVPLPKGWQPFKCDLCKKEFFTKFQLREHKLIHFEDNPFVCELCGNGFKSRTGLNSHMFHKHSSVRKHKCPDCIKSFKTRTQMKVHQRTHTGEKPFACKDPQCNYRSTTRGNMKLHLLNRHKYTNNGVNEFMRELKASNTETSGADIDDTSDFWEIPVANEEDEEETGSCIPVKMENLDVSHAAFETLVGAAAEIANTDKNFMVSNMTDEQLVQPSVGSAGQIQTIADQIMVQVVDSNKLNYNIEGHINSQSDRSVKMSGLQAQNLPRHVELFMQSANSGMHNNEITIPPGQRQMMCELQSDTVQSGMSHPDLSQDTAQQITRSQVNVSSVQEQLPLVLGSSGFQKLKSIDPHSREARMFVKQAFQGQEKKSLYKAAIQEVESESLFRRVDTHPLQTQQSFDGSGNGQTSSIAVREHKVTEDQIIHDLRQVQGQSRFTGENSNVYRIENSSQSNLLTSQQQSSSQDPLQALQQAPVSPPAYHLASQSDSSLLMAHLQMRHGHEVNQGHGHQATSSSMPHSHDFSNIVVTQSTTSQFSNSEEQLYPGFYQETYQIENY